MLGFALDDAMRSVALATLASSVLACASAAPPRVVVHSRVSVVVLPSPDELPFDPNDARLAEASAQLSALAGHPLVFEFDVALLPDWRADFQQMLIGSIESVVRDLDHLAHQEPRVFSHGAPLIERVVARYDAQVAHGPEWKFDPAARVLLLRRMRLVRGTVPGRGCMRTWFSVPRGLRRTPQRSGRSLWTPMQAVAGARLDIESSGSVLPTATATPTATPTPTPTPPPTAMSTPILGPDRYGPGYTSTNTRCGDVSAAAPVNHTPRVATP